MLRTGVFDNLEIDRELSVSNVSDFIDDGNAFTLLFLQNLVKLALAHRWLSTDLVVYNRQPEQCQPLL